MPLSNTGFVGRREYLDQIEVAFFTENIKVLGITSTESAESGKTVLANEYCFRYNSKDTLNNYVYCLKADEKNLSLEFKEIAKNLDTKDIKEIERMDKKDVLYEIKSILALIQNENVLFLFNDCENFEEINYFVTELSQLNKVRILITSKNTNSLSISQGINSKILDIKHFHHEELNNEECAAFMKTKLDEKDRVQEFLSLFSNQTKFTPEILLRFADAIKKDRINPLAMIMKKIDKLEKFKKIISDYNLELVKKN
jgi:hypothetical protein